MSAHGYKVAGYGYFAGVCGGRGHAPIELDVTEAVKMVASLKRFETKHRDDLLLLELGALLPETVRDYASNKPKPFENGSDYEKRAAVASAISKEKHLANTAKAHAEHLEARMTAFAGKEMKVVADPVRPTPINIGEKRNLGDKVPVATVFALDGARVRWKDAKGYKGWTGAAAWRKFPLL